MAFIKYPHLERYGTTEVQDIDMGECYIFPKIDGTNGSLWLEDGNVYAGSRNRTLTLDNDNAGFMAWALEQGNIMSYLLKHPDHHLYGEWLVPHALQTYREDCWRKFYVFDVGVIGDDGEMRFMHYEEYKLLLEAEGIEYIPAMCKVTNGTLEFFQNALDKNTFLIKDGEGFGEGITLKNYAYKNKYGRTTWAKMVRNEFKDLHTKASPTAEIGTQKLCEEEIIKKYITLSLVEKELAKIQLEEDGWTSKKIPKLLNIIFYNLIREECWNFVKEFNMPRIDFKLLQRHCFQHTKQMVPHLFA